MSTSSCKKRFKYEDFQTAMMFINPGELRFIFDLKSGYHHVEIAVHHRKYLGSEWEGHFYVCSAAICASISVICVYKFVTPLG